MWYVCVIAQIQNIRRVPSANKQEQETSKMYKGKFSPSLGSRAISLGEVTLNCDVKNKYEEMPFPKS